MDWYDYIEFTCLHEMKTKRIDMAYNHFSRLSERKNRIDASSINSNTVNCTLDADCKCISKI